MKIAYYIITIIISALATGLFLLISFPLNKEAMSALLVAAMFVAFLITNISGLIKKDFIPGVMLTKAGILLDGFGAFCIDAVFIGGHMSIPFCFFILLLWILGLVCILEGISICKSKREMRVAEEEEKLRKEMRELDFSDVVNAGLPGDPSAPVKKIWQYQRGVKPLLSGKESSMKWTFLVLSIAGAFVGLVLPMILMFSFNIVLYEDQGGLLLFLLSFLSIMAFAFTLGAYKEHHTENLAFVLGEDGSVYVIDYFNQGLAREFGYYLMLPRLIRDNPASKVNTVLYGADAERCFRYIVENGIDKKIAAERGRCGYQISAVPEIKRCGYYSEIHFSVWMDGSEHEYKKAFNLYDNCYEDYEEMIDYFETKFTHRYDEAYKKKTTRLRVLTGIGATILSIGVISFIGILVFEMDNLYLPGFLGLLLGISLLASGLDSLHRRHTVIPARYKYVTTPMYDIKENTPRKRI
ncbi:hypothetical protein SAMN02910370_02723 [Lachnospiraceae bacterium XPB1003]|nr:hypothetical protein SAMN02910370_02723 [Lachnospiraceae bacterium XPB1003]